MDQRRHRKTSHRISLTSMDQRRHRKTREDNRDHRISLTSMDQRRHRKINRDVISGADTNTMKVLQQTSFYLQFHLQTADNTTMLLKHQL